MNQRRRYIDFSDELDSFGAVDMVVMPVENADRNVSRICMSAQSLRIRGCCPRGQSEDIKVACPAVRRMVPRKGLARWFTRKPLILW